MGVRGPLPKSAEERVFEGGRAHRPLPHAGRVYPAGIPERPSGMPAKARRVWDNYVDQMATMGILRPVDAFALQRLCEDVATLQELQGGMRQIATDREKADRDRRKRLRAIREEAAQLAAGGELMTKIDELKIEEARLVEELAQRPEGSALVAFSMSHEGRRLFANINVIASRIARQETQFGLTPVSSQRLEGTGGMGMIPMGSAQPHDSIEQRLGMIQ